MPRGHFKPKGRIWLEVSVESEESSISTSSPSSPTPTPGGLLGSVAGELPHQEEGPICKLETGGWSQEASG